MSDDPIKQLVQTYFECMYESAADKARAAFHPDAKITGYLPDGLNQMTVEEFAGFVASHQPSPADKGEPRRLEIVSREVAGNTAAVRVRCDYLGLTFLDTLSLLNVDGRWTIYNKLFHVEGEAG
ncbi:MAG: nuclear transport factor 2 family protein [Xanthomonadales bacterium]|nr:nuclear transport factor 2 family protein [Xanthomonadales bacterium]